MITLTDIEQAARDAAQLVNRSAPTAGVSGDGRAIMFRAIFPEVLELRKQRVALHNAVVSAANNLSESLKNNDHEDDGN